MHWLNHGLSSFFTTPLNIIIACYNLYNLIGYTVFAGIGLIALNMYLQKKIRSYTGNLWEKIHKTKDKRIQLIVETINHIKTIKFYSW